MRRANSVFGPMTLAIVLSALSLSVVVTQPQADSISERKASRAVRQSQIDDYKRQILDINYLRSHYHNGLPDGAVTPPRLRTESVGNSSRSSTNSPPPPSPGIVIALTSWDYQGNYSIGYRVARTIGSDRVHFTWMGWNGLPAAGVDDNDRYVLYNSYNLDGNTIQPGFGGAIVDEAGESRGGYPSADVWHDSTFVMTLHQREDVGLPYSPWFAHFSAPGTAIHNSEQLTGYSGAGCNEVLWPQMAASRDGDRSVHVLAHANSNLQPGCEPLLWYWRYNGVSWTGPIVIDTTDPVSYIVADDPTGDKVAVVVHQSEWPSMNGLNNVVYMESATDGAGWISGSESIVKNAITNYSDPNGPQSWLHLAACYDYNSVLHIVYDEQLVANLSGEAAIRHWNSQRQMVRTVALGDWDTPMLSGVFNLNLAKLSIGVGAGTTLCQGGAESNENYLYLLYTQFGGPTAAEQGDHSAAGYYNGELYLTASTTAGNTWSTPTNLTNTKTPQCNPGPADGPGGEPQRPDSVCRSEHWASLGLAVDDIDILLISDLDAGAVVQGEGSWQLNPVHYYHIPGGTTDAAHLCPLVAPNFEASLDYDPLCEFHAAQTGQDVSTLTISNLGNSDLTGTIAVTDFPDVATLELSLIGPYTIPDGDPDLSIAVTMLANGAPEGLYPGEITISHNDPAETSPRTIPIEFFIFNTWYCPEIQVPMMTASVDENGPGSLRLDVQNNGRFGGFIESEGGLWRHVDSSSSILDGSLIVAHGTQDPDTTVYLSFYQRASNGQNGFRPHSPLITDQTAYGTDAGCATASTRVSTQDSIVGIDIEWYYPQNHLRDQFIVAKFQLYRYNQSVPITDLALGLLIDFDVLPAIRLGSIQKNAMNFPGSDGSLGLVWIGGADTAGHIVLGPNTAERFRAGIVSETPFPTVLVGNADSDIKPGGGPTDGFLYSAMQSALGIDLYSDSDTDLYMLMVLDRDRDIASGETLTYKAIFVSDTISEVSLKATVDTALAALPNLCQSCSCPCAYDPACDGILSDVLDVVTTIDVSFRGAPPVWDPGCPYERRDVNADGAVDVLDVVKVVNVAFRGQTLAANYINPCQ